MLNSYWHQFDYREIQSMHGIENEKDPSHESDEMDLATIDNNDYSKLSDTDMLTWRDFL